jgi:aminoglycoside phosphotransferase (APT) family kinase protein
MEAIEGTRIEKAGTEQRPLDISASAIEVLQRLQALPLDRTGIGDEEPVGLQAEMMRWAWLMQRAPEELTTRAGELGEELVRKVPEERGPTLVHGDYHYGNMLFRGADVVAVLDWEIAQIGQPLLDLGCLCIVSVRRQYEGAPNPGGAIDVDVEDLYRLYGADPGEMRWYLALSLYKYASIFGYNLMLHRRGKRPDPMYEGLTDTITGMIDEGITLLARSA